MIQVFDNIFCIDSYLLSRNLDTNLQIGKYLYYLQHGVWIDQIISFILFIEINSSKYPSELSDYKILYEIHVTLHSTNKKTKKLLPNPVNLFLLNGVK